MHTLGFNVGGMICSGCTGRVQRAAVQLDGIRQTALTLEPGLVRVVACPDRATAKLGCSA